MFFHRKSKSSNPQIFKSFKSSNLQILKSSNLSNPRIFKSLKSSNLSNLQTLNPESLRDKSSNPQILKSSNPQILKSSNLSNPRIFKPSNPQIFQILKSSNLSNLLIFSPPHLCLSESFSVRECLFLCSEKCWQPKLHLLFPVQKHPRNAA